MSTQSHYEADVLVLGAGIAGLIAARHLVKAGRKVIIIEAQDRVGGRIHSVESPDLPTPMELGPEFVHGKVPQTFTLLKEAGLVAYDVAERHEELHGGNFAVTDKEWAAADELLAKVKEVPADKDVSFAAFLDQYAADAPDAVKKRAIGFVEGYNAASKEIISSRALAMAIEAEAEIDDTQFRLIAAYERLPRAVARAIEAPSAIHLQTRVTRIEWSPGKVRVTATAQATETVYSARAAVIALPLGVLQRPADQPGGIAFEPELPTRSLLREHLVMGPVVKAVTYFREAWWEHEKDEGVSFVHDLSQPFPTWWTTLPLRTERLTGWCGGSKADRLPRDEAAIVRVAIESLSNMTGRSYEWVAQQIERIHIVDWRDDPNTFGAYSYVRTGGAGAAQKITEPIDHTLYFAGEHTNIAMIGTVAGAIATGDRAAEQYLADQTLL